MFVSTLLKKLSNLKTATTIARQSTKLLHNLLPLYTHLPVQTFHFSKTPEKDPTPTHHPHDNC